MPPRRGPRQQTTVTGLMGRQRQRQKPRQVEAAVPSSHQVHRRGAKIRNLKAAGRQNGRILGCCRCDTSGVRTRMGSWASLTCMCGGMKALQDLGLGLGHWKKRVHWQVQHLQIRRHRVEALPR